MFHLLWIVSRSTLYVYYYDTIILVYQLVFRCTHSYMHNMIIFARHVGSRSYGARTYIEVASVAPDRVSCFLSLSVVAGFECSSFHSLLLIMWIVTAPFDGSDDQAQLLTSESPTVSSQRTVLILLSHRAEAPEAWQDLCVGSQRCSIGY